MDDPDDKIEIGPIPVLDCTELDRQIDPPFRIRKDQSYVVSLHSVGFKSNEKVEGRAAIEYSLFVDLSNDVAPPLTYREWADFDILETARFDGHSGAVTGATFLTDDLAVSAGIDKTIRFWAVDDGSEHEVLHHSQPHARFWTNGSVALSSPHALVANSLSLWDLWGRKLIREFDVTSDPVAINDVAFFRLSSTSAGFDAAVLALYRNNSRSPRIEVWNLTTGEVLRSVETWANSAVAVDVSVLGGLLATGGPNGWVLLRNLETLKETSRLSTAWRNVRIRAVAFSSSAVLSANGDHTISAYRFPDNAWESKGCHGSSVRSIDALETDLLCCVVTASEDGLVYFWKWPSLELTHTFDGHTAAVNSAMLNQSRFGPILVVTASDDGTSRVLKLRRM
ncbi:WD40 repeat domain-containing protein [Tautonia rosea]|uniref:WD40 repeat domain-containing protein n=1 Tax=Tautonia rosea TaxID=2728037 RepID=UPI001473BE1E|nr:hypothetical protein [Tautonia rosea]